MPVVLVAADGEAEAEAEEEGPLGGWEVGGHFLFLSESLSLSLSLSLSSHSLFVSLCSSLSPLSFPPSLPRRNGLSACPAGPGEPRARADVRGTASGRRGEHRPCGPDRARPQAYLPMPSWIAPLPPLLFAEMVCRWTGATPRDPPFARAAKDAALEKSTHRRRAESSLRQRTPTRTVLPSNRTVQRLMGGSPTNEDRRQIKPSNVVQTVCPATAEKRIVALPAGSRIAKIEYKNQTSKTLVVRSIRIQRR